MNTEPAKADPEDVARKVAAAPGLKLPPPPSYELQYTLTLPYVESIQVVGLK